MWSCLLFFFLSFFKKEKENRKETLTDIALLILYELYTDIFVTFVKLSFSFIKSSWPSLVKVQSEWRWRCVYWKLLQKLCHFIIFLVYHLHLSLNRKGRWGTTDDFITSCLCFSLFSTALWELTNSRHVHSLMLSSHLFCLPCLLPPFTVLCKMGLVRLDEQETCLYHYSLCLFMMVRRSSCGPIAWWILAQTSSLVTWSLYEMHSILW